MCLASCTYILSSIIVGYLVHCASFPCQCVLGLRIMDFVCIIISRSEKRLFSHYPFRVIPNGAFYGLCSCLDHTLDSISVVSRLFQTSPMLNMYCRVKDILC